MYTVTATQLDNPVWLAGEDPDALTAVVAWHRTGFRNTAFTVTDEALSNALRAAGRQLTAATEQRDCEIAAVQAANRASRLTRAITEAPPEPEPPRITIDDPDAVARWLVAHVGRYQLTVGRWWWYEGTKDGEDAVSPERMVYAELDGWANVQDRCARWVVYRRLLDHAAAHPADAGRTRTLALAVLTGVNVPGLLQDELEDGWRNWYLKPPEPARPEAATDEDEGEEAPDVAEPRTEATPGRRPLTDAKLDERIERRCRTFWKEHQRGPQTQEELSNSVRGARAERILARIKVLHAEGVLVYTEKGYRVDE